MNESEKLIISQASDLLSQAATLLSTLAVPTPTPVQPPKPVTPSPSGGSLRTLAWGNKVSEQFRNSVFWIEQDLLIDADNLMACIAFETGERFTSDVKNPSSTATGLIQFMEFTAKRLGTTTKALAAMTPENQLNFVWKYFAQWPKGTFKTLEDTYMGILYPKAIGKPLNFQMFIKGDDNYVVNAGLDVNKDHAVTKAEAAAKVLEKFNRGMKPPFVWEGTEWHV